MLKKIVILVCDGLGDRPIKNLGALTPLEAAKTPNLDALAKEAECGMMYTLGRCQVPGSDVAHLAIMGYSQHEYYSGRGTIEVAGIGINLRPGDVALRGNFGTVDDNQLIIDRRAGRIRVVEQLTQSLDGLEIDGVKFVVKPGTGHRAGIVMRGEGLSNAIIDADPHKPGIPIRNVTPTNNSPKAQRTAQVLNKFLEKSHEILKKHPLNEIRKKEGKYPANYLLVRGAGFYKKVPSFEERYNLSSCCIAGGGLYKGVGSFLGMKVIKVPEATGLPDTNIKAKFQSVLTCIDKYDFVFVHVKAADSLGEDGNFEGKKNFIEKLDSASKLLLNLPDDVLLIITADHSTPCELKSHSADAVPILYRGNGVRTDDVMAFNERACKKGGLGIIEGKHVIPHAQNLLGTLKLVGA